MANTQESPPRHFGIFYPRGYVVVALPSEEAPSDAETHRVMNAARRLGYVKAQKYDRFTITVL